MSVPNVMRYAGLALEASFGVDPVPEAVIHNDVQSATLDTPTDVEIPVPGGIGREAITHRPGPYIPAGNVVINADVETATYYSYLALGEYVYTDTDPAVPPGLHEIYPTDNNVLPSGALRIGKDVFEHVFSGCTFGGLDLTVNNQGFVTITPNVTSRKDGADTLKTLAELNLPTTLPRMYHETTVEIDGGDKSAEMRDFALAIDNGLSTDPGQGLGSRFISIAGVYERTITANGTLRFANMDAITDFWGNSSGPIDPADPGTPPAGTVEKPMLVTINGGAEGTIILNMPRALITAAPAQPSGRTEMTQAIAWRMYPDNITLNDAITIIYQSLLVTINNNLADITLP